MSKNTQWILRVTDQLEREHLAKGKSPDAEIICASGISPSGTIHLGNMREIITAHLIKEELIRRGRKAIHLHFWDNYDRFRKVPANISPDFEQYIGMPLSSVPDPFGEHASYAAHFMAEFASNVEKIGIFPTYISQEEAYTNNIYRDLIIESFKNRVEIFKVLSLYQTEEQQKNNSSLVNKYYPFKTFCENCGKDTTEIVSYDEASTVIHYACHSCGKKNNYALKDKAQGKLVWKVDWPMRWKYYGIDFEPGGLDHSTPGSSFTVGKQIVKEIFDAEPPFYAGYAFVGITGGTDKISSSAGTDATPERALSILEPSLLRWLYIRTDIRSSFNINFDDQIFRIYDEWDRLSARVADDSANEQEQFIYQACVKADGQQIAHSDLAISFRLLTSVYQITQGNEEEIFRIINHHSEVAFTKEDLLDKIEIRLRCAANWVNHFLPEEERIVVRKTFDSELFGSFDETTVEGLGMLVNELEENWSLSKLTSLVYGIPKRQLNLPLDVKPTDELKQVQRTFFNAIYRMLLGKETGPRLPTLFLSLGLDKLRALLTP